MFMMRTMSTSAILGIVIVVPVSGQFPPDLGVSDLDGTAGFTVSGHLTREFGVSVARIGDVNGDGIDDMGSGGPGVSFPPPDCGGCPGECDDCDPTPGAVYVIFGRSDIGGDGSWSTEDLDGSNGFRVPGINPKDSAGAVSPAGDFNNDGIDDFLVGANDVSPFGILFAGEAYLIYGGPGLGAEGSFDVSSLDGTNGFTIRGTFGFGNLGLSRSMAEIGDFNGDGAAEVALGASGADPPGGANAGQVYLLFGGSGLGASGSVAVPTDLSAEVGIVFNGIFSGDVASRVAAAGDFNGDGLADLLILAIGADPGPDAQGEVYVVYGGLDAGDSGVFELADLDGSNGFAINGGPLQQLVGIAGVGDLNADGFDDVTVAVNTSDDYVGVIFGGPDVAPDGLFCLEDLNGDNGFKLVGAGARVADAGDMNDDGVDDMMVSTVIIFGSPGIGGSGIVQFDDIHDGQQAVWFHAQFTRGRGAAGDVNDDGLDDMMVGVEYDVDFCDLGKLHVVFGRRMGDADLDADIDFADFGAFQACFGDPPDGDVPDECHPFDFDLDNDVDLTDFAAFQLAFGTSP